MRKEWQLLKGLALKGIVVLVTTVLSFASLPASAQVKSGVSPAPPSQESAESGLQLKLLHINDHHSMLEESSLQIRAKTDDSGRREIIKVELGGFSRIKTAIDDILEKLGGTDPVRHIIKLHAGDALNGSLYYTLMQGKADADLMNLLCFDAMSLGNHEFDSGDLALANFIEVLQQSRNCQTSVVSANLILAHNSPLHASGILPYKIFTKDQTQVAVIGITPVIATMYASRPDEGTTFANELSTLRATINALNQQNIHHIILLSHLGYDEDKRIAQALPEVDVIVGGHTHSLLGSAQLKEFGLQAQAEYPTKLRNQDGDLVCLVQAWQYGSALGDLNIDFDQHGKLRSCEGQVHLLIGDEFTKANEQLSEAEQQYVLQDLAKAKEWRITEKSPIVEEVLAPFRQQIEAFSQEEIAQAQANFCARRVPGAGRDGAAGSIASCSDDPQVQAHGGQIQQLVAYAFLFQGKVYGGADIALVNGGGVRTEIAAGPVTTGDIYEVLPFRNTLVRIHITGQELKKVLEEALLAVSLGSTGSYPYAANLRWSVDMQALPGRKLSQLEVKQVDGTWQALDAERTYSLITSDFLAEGKDGYRTFATLERSKIENTYLVYADAFLQYARKKGSLTKLADADFSTQKYSD